MTIRNGHRFTVLLCGLTLSMVSSAGFAAVNLLTNPSFDNGLAGWTVLDGYKASWSPVDANGNPNSGSAIAVNDWNPGISGVPLALGQCVGVAPSTKYSFGGHLMVPAGQPADTHAYLFAQYYASDDCSSGSLGNTQLSNANVAQWRAYGVTITTGPTVHSIRVAVGATKPVGVTAEASAHFDDLYLQPGTGGTWFVIDPSMSASWFNPAQSGHGIMLELLDSTQAWMCWFTFDTPGNRAWICSLGKVGGVTVDFAEAFTVEGGNFPPAFDPKRIVEVPWGRITVTFSGCDSGTMTWTTAAPGFQSGSMPLSRLTTLWGNPCQ
jgi:hypothetical protein